MLHQRWWNVDFINILTHGHPCCYLPDVDEQICLRISMLMNKSLLNWRRGWCCFSSTGSSRLRGNNEECLWICSKVCIWWLFDVLYKTFSGFVIDTHWCTIDVRIYIAIPIQFFTQKYTAKSSHYLPYDPSTVLVGVHSKINFSLLYPLLYFIR